MVGVTKIQRGNAGYWLAAVAQGGDDYYTKPGEAPGEWVGSLADEFGLSGQVDPAGYGAILEGRDPRRGAQLLHRPETRFRQRADGSEQRVEPVLGYDVRFSAPKSVSLLYALGSPETQKRIIAVMDEAVRQGIAHLEAEACMVQRGKGGKEIEPGEGFFGMAFRHRMSRAGDPALHVHVVISNLTRALSDGKWLSLASPKGRSPLYPHGKSAGVIFQAVLRAGMLREFGLEFDSVRNGYADVKGFSRDVIEEFSTRAREIRDWLDKHGVFTIKAAQTAAYRTRDAKDHSVDADQRVEEWVAQAEPHGLTPEGVEAMVVEARSREPRGISDEDLAQAVESLEGSSSHFGRRELLWALAEQLPEGADLAVLDHAVDRALASELVISVRQAAGPLDPAIFTTPKIRELERYFIDTVLNGGDAGVGVVSPGKVESILRFHDYLGEDQREMVRRLAGGGERVIAVAAWPGTGKTTALQAAAEAWRAQGIPVIGCTTARTATGELKVAGVEPSYSIAKLLKLVSEGMKLDRGTTIVVDEANVASTFELAAVLSLVIECGGKLAVIGDDMQIGAIGPGGLFALTTRVSEPVRLTTIRRQHRESDRRIVALVHERRGSEALDLLRAEDKLIVGDDLISTLNGLLIDWHRDFVTGADAVMIARRNLDVEYLNDEARELRRQEGRLGDAEVIVGERPIAAGDRVQTRINGRRVDNRERWDVLAVDPAARTVKLQRVGGDEREETLGPGYLNLETENGDPALQYAYAITKFNAESKTFDRAYPLLDSGASLEQELVAISRGREIANVYTVASSELLDPDLGPARREIIDVLDDLRQAIERQGADYPAIEVKTRERIQALSDSELAKRRTELAKSAVASDPTHSRRERLDRAIAHDRDVIKRISGELAATEQMASPPAAEIARLRAAELSAVERLRGNLTERDELGEAAPREPMPSSPKDRLEAVLIEQRISQLVSREITAARSGESHAIFDALGSYPADPAKAAAWSDAAHAVASYRLRHGVRDGQQLLGREPRSAAARAERTSAERRVSTALRELGRDGDRGLERSAGQEMEVSL